MRRAWVAFAALSLLPVLSADGPEVLTNGSFQDWEEGKPTGWTVGVGATTGSGSESGIEPLPGGGVALVGSGDTRVWRMLSQKARPTEEAPCRLTYEARLLGGRLEAGQRDNAYVGLRERAGISAHPVFADVWTPEEFVTHNSWEGLEALIFLSKSGRLEVRRIELEVIRPQDSFDVLVRNMGRYYPTFPLRKIDWPAHAAKFRERALAAADAGAFVEILKEMLAPLRDLHVQVTGPGLPLTQVYVPDTRPNFDLREVVRTLAQPKQIGKVALVGDLEPRIGFVAVYSLLGTREDYAEIGREIDRRDDRDGWIVDLRGNIGGDERWASEIAARFADEDRVYAVRRVRSGAAPDALGAPKEARIAPRDGKRFAKPIVCLIGPGCVSSGEGFAQMMAAMPHVTMVGQSTRGASGNPQPIELPNRVMVVYSRWVDFLPDGTVLEERGVPPDVVVPHEGPGDPTFEAGLKLLREKIAR